MVAVIGHRLPSPASIESPMEADRLASGACQKEAKGISPTGKPPARSPSPTCLGWNHAGSSSCSAPPHPALSSCPCQPQVPWLCGTTTCAPVCPLGSWWLQVCSSLASLLISEPQFSHLRNKDSSFSKRLPLPQVRCARCPLDEVSPGQLQGPCAALGLRTWEQPDTDPTCGQHFNLQQSFRYMTVVTP